MNFFECRNLFREKGWKTIYEKAHDTYSPETINSKLSEWDFLAKENCEKKLVEGIFCTYFFNKCPTSSSKSYGVKGNYNT